MIFGGHGRIGPHGSRRAALPRPHREDRKSTRLNSSHSQISYAVFCLKKKKNTAQAALAQDRRPGLVPLAQYRRSRGPPNVINIRGRWTWRALVQTRHTAMM